MPTIILADGTKTETDSGTVEEILSRIGLNPYEVLATSNGELMLEDDFCDENSVIRLTSIVHGG